GRGRSGHSPHAREHTIAARCSGPVVLAPLFSHDPPPSSSHRSGDSLMSTIGPQGGRSPRHVDMLATSPGSSEPRGQRFPKKRSPAALAVEAASEPDVRPEGPEIELDGVEGIGANARITLEHGDE